MNVPAVADDTPPWVTRAGDVIVGRQADRLSAIVDRDGGRVVLWPLCLLRLERHPSSSGGELPSQARATSPAILAAAINEASRSRVASSLNTQIATEAVLGDIEIPLLNRTELDRVEAALKELQEARSRARDLEASANIRKSELMLRLVSPQGGDVAPTR